MKTFHALQLRCRVCGAKPGERCHDTTDRQTDLYHNPRCEDAERETKRWRAWEGDKAAAAKVPPL